MPQLVAEPATRALSEYSGVHSINLARVDEVIDHALESSLREIKDADRRTRNRSRTTEAILRSAWRLFLTVGYEQTTIQDITESADIGKGTFFSHFAKKSDVALYLCNHRRDTILELYHRGAFGAGTASSRIENMMVSFAKLNADEDLEARLMTEIVLRQFFAGPGIMGPDRLQIEDALEELLVLGVETKELGPHIDCESGAQLIHAALYSAKAAWLRSGPLDVPFDLPNRVRDDVRVILRGLRA
jgi:AcrR family transcriptional regulator